MQSTRARKRLTRREIKEDKLLVFFSRASMFIEDNLWSIVGGVGALVVLVIGYYIYTGWYARQTERGMEQVAGLELMMRAEQYDAVITRANQIINGYAGLPDRTASLYKADALRAKGDYAAAKRLYEGWSGRGEDEVHSYHATKGFADCLSAEQQFARAGEVLRKWAKDHKKSGFAPHALMEAATNFELANRYREAREVLQKILDDYRESQVVGRARQRLKLMEGAVAAVR